MIGRFLEKDRLRAVFVYLLGNDIPGRKIYVEPDDTFIVSYPRSGNTWTRFLIANLLHPDKSVSFANIETLIPDIHAVPRKLLRTVPQPRVIKSHEYFDLRYQRLIYIVRDPRDVAVSYFHFHRKFDRIPHDYSIENYIPRFIAGEFDPYGSWGQNVASWIATRQNTDGFLLLRYEDMKQDPVGGLGKVAEFFGLHATPEQLARAAELSSADHMRKLESAQSDLWVVTKSGRKDIPFVRAAKPGGWKDSLSPAALGAIESAWGPLMKYLKYEISAPADAFDLYAHADSKSHS